VHKDRVKELKKKKSKIASAALDDAIAAIQKVLRAIGDYYPGVMQSRY